MAPFSTETMIDITGLVTVSQCTIQKWLPSIGPSLTCLTGVALHLSLDFNQRPSWFTFEN